MCARNLDVNYTSVNVVFCPAAPFERAVLQITIRPAKSLDEKEHAAFHDFLTAVERFQESVL